MHNETAPAVPASQVGETIQTAISFSRAIAAHAHKNPDDETWTVTVTLQD